MITGENTQALQKILDLTRAISLITLLLHFYFFCYSAFQFWGLTAPAGDWLLIHIRDTGLFTHFERSKWTTLLFLSISLLGAQGRKMEKLYWQTSLIICIFGVLLFFSGRQLFSKNMPLIAGALLYMGMTLTGYLLLMMGGTLLTRVIKWKLNGDIFNKENERFPQEERFIDNPYSINLPAQYPFKGKIRKSWINIINPFRGLLVIGSPGSGKSYFVIREAISQHIRKGFSLFVYDFKFDDLSKIAYKAFLQYRGNYPVTPHFFILNFDNLSFSHRCNPLAPGTLQDITDAAESARTILIALNREWSRRHGDFFVESPIHFLTALIWFLRKWKDGAFCSLPHVVEFMQMEYDELFTLLRTLPETETLAGPFISAYMNDAKEQLEGQIGSAKIALSRLVSPQLYYVLSGNDFTLDINNPNDPKIVCMGNNPQKQQVYGAVLSLYISRLIKLVNRKGGQPCSLIFDEFPTIYFNTVDSLMATARSNKVATLLSVQDYSQLKKEYGREQAEVIMNIAGNLICGQASGDTASQLSERFGKIVQHRAGHSIQGSDISMSRSEQLAPAIPPSAIAGLSSGEFVGMVADDPDQKIQLKTFHCKILTGSNDPKNKDDMDTPIPQVVRLKQDTVMENYIRIKEEVRQMIADVMDTIINDPSMQHKIVKKKKAVS